ncbi:MAG: hypothetical protein WCW17_03955 [Patescibacteria group bacterium]|jgi:hypothetical protein
MENKIIFVGGIRGCGKTSLLSRIKNYDRFHFFNDILKKILKTKVTWNNAEILAAEKIINLCQNKIIFIDLHYAVPSERISKDINEGKVRDFSKLFNECLSFNFLKEFNNKPILFVFILILADFDLIKLRLSIDKNRLQVSDDYLNNMDYIQKQEIEMFQSILNDADKLELKVESKILKNNDSFESTLKKLRQIVS